MGSPVTPQLARSRSPSVSKSDTMNIKSCTMSIKSCTMTRVSTSGAVSIKSRTMSTKSRSMSIHKPFGRPAELSYTKFIIHQIGVLKDVRKGSMSRIRYKGETRLRKLAVALSCGAYNIPGLIVHYRWKTRSKKLKMSLQAWFWIQSLVSFLSDVHYAGRTSLVHWLDRIFASGTMSGMCVCWLYVIKRRPLLWAVITMLHGILSLQFLRKSRKSKNYMDFAIWHCLWHYFGAYSMSLLMAIAA